MQRKFGTPISSGEEMSSSKIIVSQFTNTWFGYVSMIYGKRESGKTTLCLNLLKQMIWEKRVDKLIIIGDKTKYPDWATIYNDNDIPDIYKYITDTKNKSARKLLIVDKENTNSKLLDNLIANNFDYNLTVIITRNNLSSSITPLMSDSSNYIFIMEEMNNSNLKSLWDRYGGMFETLDSFKKILKTIASNYMAMVIKKYGKMENINDCVYWCMNKKLVPNELTEVDTIIPLSEKQSDKSMDHNSEQMFFTKKEIIREINAIKFKLDSIIEKLDMIGE